MPYETGVVVLMPEGYPVVHVANPSRIRYQRNPMLTHLLSGWGTGFRMSAWSL
ncbi:hypothetical protein JOF53_000512 [Crossiella equi]|uniref:Uncharacterized protein n=1 Tax=Crossiella equi TaxID=130796 RepID=A0ABS5A7G9_9PSEU|nr:hypothetical protein [Crossiella equi]